MDLLLKKLQMLNWEQFIITCSRIAFVILLAVLFLLVLRKALGKLEDRLIEKSKIEGEPPSESRKRVQTLTYLIRQAAFIVVWVTALLILLKEIKVDIAPLLASAGIIGLAIGFGAQSLVRDFISGFFFILENQVRVGDVAVVNGTGGLVEKINFRTIVLRDLGGVVHIIPNGSVTTLSNLTNEWSAYVFDIGVAYKENTDKVIEVMKRVGSELKKDAIVGPLMLEEPEVFGVERFDTSAVVIKGRVRTKPIRQWQVGREYLRRIKLAFDESGIEIPVPQQKLNFGESSKPIEVAVLEKLQGEKIDSNT